MSEDTRRLLGDINRRLGRVERNGVHYRVNDDGDPTLVWQGGSVGFDGTGSSSGVGTGWFNVKSYGAVGDGTTDDRAAIQAAMDAADAAGGGTVFFPPCAGGYGVDMSYSHPDNVNATIVVPSNTVVMGSGYAGRLERIGTLALSTFRWMFSNNTAIATENITFKDLWCQGNFSPTGGQPIQVYDAYFIRIERYGTDNCYAIRYENNTVYDMPGGAFSGYNIQRFVIANNLVFDCPREGLGLYSNCRKGVIADNTFDGVADDVIALNGDQDNNGYYAEDITISGNYCRQHDGTYFGLLAGGNNGIAVRAGHGITVTGNVIENANYHGIGITDFQQSVCERIAVVGNHINGSANDAIRLGGAEDTGTSPDGDLGGSGYIIADNHIKDSTYWGINVWPWGPTGPISAISITGNVIESCGNTTGYGGINVDENVLLGGGTVSRLDITGNQIYAPREAAINLTPDSDVAHLHLHGNSIYDASIVGISDIDAIQLQGTLDRFQVSNNTLTAPSGVNARYGINVGAGCTNGLIHGNLALDADFYGGGINA